MNLYMDAPPPKVSQRELVNLPRHGRKLIIEHQPPTASICGTSWFALRLTCQTTFRAQRDGMLFFGMLNWTHPQLGSIPAAMLSPPVEHWCRTPFWRASRPMLSKEDEELGAYVS